MCPLFIVIFKAFQSVYQFPYILCYNVLSDFVPPHFFPRCVASFIRIRNALWKDIIQGRL